MCGSAERSNPMMSTVSTPIEPAETENSAATHAILIPPEMIAVCVTGPPGCGKTSLVASTARQLAPEVRCGAIVASPTAGADAGRLERSCGAVLGIETDTLTARELAW